MTCWLLINLEHQKINFIHHFMFYFIATAVFLSGNTSCRVPSSTMPALHAATSLKFSVSSWLIFISSLRFTPDTTLFSCRTTSSSSIHGDRMCLGQVIADATTALAVLKIYLESTLRPEARDIATPPDLPDLQSVLSDLSFSIPD